MKKIANFKIRAVTAMLALSLMAGAQPDHCNFRKSYKVSEKSTLTILNRYGDINIVNSDNDSLTICATVTMQLKDKTKEGDQIKQIRIGFDSKRDTITATTVFDKKFFLQKYSIQREKFSIDYIIKAPAYLNLKITNSFGNVTLDEPSGAVDILLSQGMLTAKNLSRGNIKPINSIKINNGKAGIDLLNWASFELRNSPLITIGKATAIMIESEYSKVEIGEVNSLIADSKSDKYKVQTINNIQTESTYSTFEIGILGSIMKSGTTLGAVTVSGLKKDFNTISINSDRSLIIIRAADNISFQTNIESTGTEVDINSQEGLRRSLNGNMTKITGIYGDDKKSGSTVRVTALSGKVSIR